MPCVCARVRCVVAAAWRLCRRAIGGVGRFRFGPVMAPTGGGGRGWLRQGNALDAGWVGRQVAVCKWVVSRGLGLGFSRMGQLAALVDRVCCLLGPFDSAR